MKSITRLICQILAFTLATSIFVYPYNNTPANALENEQVERTDPAQFVQYTASPDNPENPFDIEPYPDYIVTKEEDLQTEKQALLSTSPDNQPGIEATSVLTVTSWRNLRPTESYLWDVSLLSPEYDVDCMSPDQKSKGWIVGDAGTILSYCNGVWDHAINVESLPTRLWGVQAISPTLGVAVGEQGAVLLYLWDRIALDWVWTKSPIPVGNQTLYHVGMVKDDSKKDLVYSGWAVGATDETGHASLVNGEIYSTTINGQATFRYSWVNRTHEFDLPTASYYYGLQMLSPTNGWASGGTPGVNGLFIHWDGQEWSLFQEVAGNAVHALHMRSPTDGWAGGYGGAIYHFNGSTWSQVASPTTNELVDIGFDENGIGWATGMNGTLLRYDNGQWSLFTDLRTDPIDFRALDFTSGHGWMVGLNKAKQIGGHILEYDEGLWQAVTPPTDNALNDLSVLTDNDAWAVGVADGMGGTIIHWDGRHWQRWYQKDLPIPAADLYAVDMISANNGWAAGDPLVAGEPAVMLHWDGHRWSPPRYDSPINVRITDISMLGEGALSTDFGWAVANTGNAIAKYDGMFNYWSANHSCGGVYYDLRSVSTMPNDTNQFGWDAWSVGSSLNPASGEYFMKYMDGCSTGFAWETYQHPLACDPPPNPDDGWIRTLLYGIKMDSTGWGYAAGNYSDRASVYYYDDQLGYWDTVWCHPPDIGVTPSHIYSVDIVQDSGVAWFGGYYTSPWYHRKVAFIQFHDELGFWWSGWIYPINGVNIYDRPIRSIDMSSDTMGWAVGDPQDSGRRSVMYQYPYPNFTLSSKPISRAVRPGEAAQFTITSNSIGGFNADVTLSYGSLPPGVTGNITPESINADTPATVQLQTSASTPLGEYDVDITGVTIFHSGDYDIPVTRTTTVKLIVTDHPIYSINPEKAPGGTLVTITGANFGVDPGAGNRSSTQNHVTWSGVQLPDASISSWSTTQVRFTPPDDPNLFSPQKFPLLGAVMVTASGTNSNGDLMFRIENHISSIDSMPNSDRMLVALDGTSFGSDPGALNRSTIYEHISVGGTWVSNYDVVSWSNHEIQFFLDMTTPTGVVVVTSNGYESNSVTYYAPGEKQGNLVYLPMLRR